MSGVEEFYRGNHVRVFRLDREGVIERLRAAATRLVSEREDVLEVRLFGSLARGDAAPGSDADILIVVRDEAGSFLERPRDLGRWFEAAGIGCDVFVYSAREVREASVPLARTALKEGRLLAGRSSNVAPAVP